MLNINPIASSSLGNAYHITDGHCPILIEAGIPFKKLRIALDFQISNLSGCLVTHSHGDHSKAVPDLLKAGVDCYMTAGTAINLGVQYVHQVKIIEPQKQFHIGTWDVLPFRTEHHDIDGTLMDSVGFLIRSGSYKILFLTDSFYSEFYFDGCTHILCEANYAADLLEKSDMPESHKKRVIQSHFSLANVKDFLKACDLSRCQQIYLIHLSAGHSDAGRFKREVEELTGIPTFVCDE